LLCFEPDPLKAKLIYFAEVTHLCGHTLRGRTYIPQYFVHFLGWKRKWDRKVPEDLLLEDSDFNRTLKRKIDELATNVKDKEKRRQRIDLVLSTAAKAREDIDWDTVPGVWKDPKNSSTFQDANKSNLNMRSISERDTGAECAYEPGELDADDLAQLNFESVDVHASFAPSPKLTQSLKSILEGHCRPFEAAVHTHPRKHLPVQSWCSVLDLLQAYLNDFPYNLSINGSPAVFKNNNGLISSGKISEILEHNLKLPRENDSRKWQLLRIKRPTEVVVCAANFVQVCAFSLMPCFLITYFTHLKKSGTPRAVNENQKGSTSPSWAATVLLPPEEIERSPSLPCLTYEAIYLLRLLIRLPTLINQMALTKCRRAIVLRHLCLFIMYLDASREYWFTNSPPPTMNPLAAPVLSTIPGKPSRASSSSSISKDRSKRSPSKTTTRKISPKTRTRPVSVVAPKPLPQLDGESAVSALPPRASGRQHSLRSSKVVSAGQLTIASNPPLVRSRKRPTTSPLFVNHTVLPSEAAFDSSLSPKRTRTNSYGPATASIKKQSNEMSVSPPPPSPRVTRSSFAHQQCQQAVLPSSPARPNSEPEVRVTRTRSRLDNSSVLRRR
uniref:MRG domain-containing protein n=1 Tax=Schistocephalus solidus TaxID=70667 RepID=A0A183TAM9_SCHSO